MSEASNRRTHGDSKSVIIGRGILAFFLFLCITAVSVLACVRIVMINPENIARIFTDEKYVSSLYQDVREYAYDLCSECSIPTDSVDECITYYDVYSVQEAYSFGNLTKMPEFTETTYQDKIDSLNKNLVSSTEKMIKDNKLSSYDTKNSIQKFSSQICDYIKSRVEFKLMDKLKPIVNYGKTISSVLAAVMAILIAVLSLIIYSIGHRRFRALRSIAHATLAAMLLDAVLVMGVQYIKYTKDLVIYPSYLCDSVLKFVDTCQMSLLAASAVLFVLSLAMITIVWKLKRNEK